MKTKMRGFARKSIKKDSLTTTLEEQYIESSIVAMHLQHLIAISRDRHPILENYIQREFDVDAPKLRKPEPTIELLERGSEKTKLVFFNIGLIAIHRALSSYIDQELHLTPSDMEKFVNRDRALMLPEMEKYKKQQMVWLYQLAAM